MSNQEPRPLNGKKGQTSVEKVIADVTSKGKNLLSEGLETARETLHENAEVFKTKAEELGDKSIEELAEDARYYVRRNPLKSVGIALGVGLILGGLFGSD